MLACSVHFYGLYAPHQAGPGTGVPGADKVAHLLLFGIVAYLGLRIGVPARWLLGLLVANAVVSELVQHNLLPQRSGDPLDSVADLAGIALATLLIRRRVAGRAMMGT